MRKDSNATKLANLPADRITKGALRPDIAVPANSCGLRGLTRLKSSSDLRLGPSLSSVSGKRVFVLTGVTLAQGGVKITGATTVCNLKPDVIGAEDAGQVRIRRLAYAQPTARTAKFLKRCGARGGHSHSHEPTHQ
jgi:hypothetical protein